MKKKIIVFVCFLTLALAVAVIIHMMLSISAIYPDHIKFDPITWKTKNKIDDQDRIHMTEDLIKNILIKGTNKAKIHKILGKKDERYGYWPKNPKITEGYYLGTAFDPCYLYIEYDQNNNLHRAYEACH